MQAVVCEVCKSKSFSKVGDFVQCDFCRTKFTVEQIRELTVNGLVTVDRSEEAANVRLLARSALENGNPADALSNAQRALEINSSDGGAWQTAGLAYLALKRNHFDLGQALESLMRAQGLGNPLEQSEWSQESIAAIRKLVDPKSFPRNRFRTEPNTPANLFAFGVKAMDLIQYAYDICGDQGLLIESEKVAKCNLQFVKIMSDRKAVAGKDVSASDLARLENRVEALADQIRLFDPRHKTPKLKASNPLKVAFS